MLNNKLVLLFKVLNILIHPFLREISTTAMLNLRPRLNNNIYGNIR